MRVIFRMTRMQLAHDAARTKRRQVECCESAARAELNIPAHTASQLWQAGKRERVRRTMRRRAHARE